MLLEASSEHPDQPRPRSRLPRSWRAVASFPVVLAALLIVLTVITVRSRFDDPDMWWHLKTGEIIWNTHSIPRVDLYSFTTNKHAYTPHEWLPQLSIYAAYHLAGYTGLMIWLCLFASLILVAGYALCWLYSGNGKVAFLGALCIWLFSTVGLAIRPQLIGYLLLICELLFICLGRCQNRKWFFMLPPLFAVWVNCHGSFFLGLLAFAAIGLCAFVEIRLGLLISHRWPKPSRNTLVVTFVLSLLALFVNPVGFNQLSYPLNALFGQHVGLAIVSEWQPSPFTDARAWALSGTAGLTLLVPLLRRTDLKLEELLLLVFGFGLAVQHQRMLFVFGILVAPTLSRLLATAWDQYEPERDKAPLNAVMLAVSAVIIFVAFPGGNNLQKQVEKDSPVSALRFIERTALPGRMLNEYVYGGYLIWAGSERKVFIDGRSDVYEWTGVLNDYVQWITLQAEPNLILTKYHVDFCLLAQNDPISRVLALMPGWKRIYSDKQSIIFAKRG